MTDPAGSTAPTNGQPTTDELRLLVTGAAGFIGSHVCERLVSEGHVVWGLDNFNEYYSPALKRRNVAHVALEPNMHLVEGDIRDAVLLDGLFSDVPFDAVIHLAARAGVRPSVEDPIRCFETNVSGTIELLEAMRRNHTGILLFGSSSSVYGDDVEVPFREDAAADRPVSPYAASKRSGELLCHTFHDLYGMSVHCLRFFTVYGPRQRPDLAIRKFAALMADDEPLPIYGDGSSSRDYTYISDIVDGVLLSLARIRRQARDEPVYETFNLGGSEPIRLDDLVERLADALGLDPTLDHQSPRAGDVSTTYASLERSSELLGYSPQVPIDEGLERFAAWFWEQRENGVSVTPTMRHGYEEAKPAGG
jgi:UDP-glucuronate 4-epimerase